MALIGKECLNCGIKYNKANLCPECREAIKICPKCNKNITKKEDGSTPFIAIIEDNFNYFINCCHCGYDGRPRRNTQIGNHPQDYINNGMKIPNDNEEAKLLKKELLKKIQVNKNSNDRR